MSSILVSICSLTIIAPFLPSFMPVSDRKPVLGLTPVENMTASTFMGRLLVFTFSTFPSPRIASNFVSVKVIIPCSARWFSTKLAISGPKPGSICSAISMTETLTPWPAKFSATSRPIKPPPTTRARLISPASMACRRVMASSGVLIK